MFDLEVLGEINDYIRKSNNIQEAQLVLLKNIHEELRIMKVRLSEINK